MKRVISIREKTLGPENRITVYSRFVLARFGATFAELASAPVTPQLWGKDILLCLAKSQAHAAP